ncbi:MAG: DUF6179 domain-containing protein [Christensenella sp.]|nr:DUF6179 domain-containing protein [Christensenella sp.]
MSERSLATINIETDSAELPEALLALLSDRIARYTMGDSTSVPVDTAQRLLEGISFCVSLHRASADSSVPNNAPLSDRYWAGVAEAKRRAKRAKLLLHQAQRGQPPVVNIGFLDTLSALPAFFHWYDAEFFAQEIPGSIDYPLCHPVSDALLGVEFVQDYLSRWLVEGRFLRAFSEGALTRLYEQYYGDYNDLLVNLYLPVAEMAVLCALAGRSIRPLALESGELRAVSERLAQADDSAAHALLIAATDRALEEAGVHGAMDRTYLLNTARDFWVRLCATKGN